MPWKERRDQTDNGTHGGEHRGFESRAAPGEQAGSLEQPG